MDKNFRKRIIRLAIAVACLLMVPLVAMQFTDEVVWTLSDFAFAGAFLFGTGLTYELIARKKGNIVYRSAIGVVLGTALLLVWANGAVGLIGSENEPFNAMYFGVIAVGIVGATMARLQPRGMAHTLLAMASATALIAVTALLLGLHRIPESSVYEILMVNGFFITLFIVSGLLFQHASDSSQSAEARAARCNNS